MGFLKLKKMTISGLFKKAETVKYPFEEKDKYDGQKGIVVNDKPTECTLCGLCKKNCPSNAIDVDRTDRYWLIDRFSCIQCGYCIDACPKKCLKMDVERPGISTEKNLFKVSIPEKKKQ